MTRRFASWCDGRSSKKRACFSIATASPQISKLRALVVRRRRVSDNADSSSPTNSDEEDTEHSGDGDDEKSSSEKSDSESSHREAIQTRLATLLVSNVLNRYQLTFEPTANGKIGSVNADAHKPTVSLLGNATENLSPIMIEKRIVAEMQPEAQMLATFAHDDVTLSQNERVSHPRRSTSASSLTSSQSSDKVVITTQLSVKTFKTVAIAPARSLQNRLSRTQN